MSEHLGSNLLTGEREPNGSETEPVALGLHQPFLERASDPKSLDSSEDALAAFLALRVVDRMADPSFDRTGLYNQLKAALSFTGNIAPRVDEIKHLQKILTKALEVHDGDMPEALLAPLGQYAWWLEDLLRLAEAADVLDTALGLARSRGCQPPLSLHLQRARVVRKSGRLTDATSAYAELGQLALEIGDTHFELLSRVGRGIVLQQLGNLPAAQELLDTVRRDAIAAGDRDAEARATHDLSVVATRQAKHEDSAVLAFRAFRLYEHEEQQLRALADLGTALLAMGYFQAAEDAFEVVLAGNITVAMRVATVLELVGLAALMGNRIAFQKRRGEVEALKEQLPPSTRVDYEMKVGNGLARFREHAAAAKHLERAVQLAEQNNLNDYLFSAESALLALRNEPPPAPAPAGTDWESQAPEVARVAHELQELRATV